MAIGRGGPGRAFEIAATDQIGVRAVRAGAAAAAAQVARLALGLAGTAVLARTLAPADFGVVALAAATIGLLAVTQELGLSYATVQRQRISHAEVSALFWVNAGFGLVLALVAAACAPLIAWAYGDARLFGIALALAAGFAVGGLAVQHRALLQRALRFTSLAVVDVSALALATGIAVSAACLGAGVWALVALPLVHGVAGTALVWLACPWRPDRPARGVDVRPLLAFGGRLSGANFLHQMSRHLDKILIGWCFGAASLGLYAKAQQLALLPIRHVNGPLASVMIPALSRLQGDPARFRRFYLGALRLLAFASLPALAAVVVLSREIIALLLGPQWLAASSTLAILAGAAAVQLIASSFGWILVSLGHTRRVLRWSALASASVVIAFALGLPWGPLGVAVAYAVCAYALRYPHLVIALRGSPVSVGDVLRTLRRPALLAGVAALAMELSHRALAGQPPALIALGVLATGGAGFGLGLALLRGARRELVEVLVQGARLAARRRASPQSAELTP